MSRNYTVALPLLAALALTACEKKAEQVVDTDRTATAVASANGKTQINGDTFDIDGVALYPASSIRTMDVKAAAKDSATSSSVKVGFESPADAKTVADWFETEMKAKGFTTTRSGYNISGKTGEGHDFTLMIGDLGGGKASGLVRVSGE